MSKPIAYKQDLPPPGGYEKLNWHRALPKKPINFLFVTGVTIFWGGFGFWEIWTVQNKREKTLKQVRRNRDWENDLMKDVVGWKTGYCWDVPVYYNKHNVWIPPSYPEYYAHNRLKDFKKKSLELFYNI